MDAVVATSGRTADTLTDAENRKKADDNFYQMDEESIVTIREELSDDFFSLVESHLEAGRRLVERLDDGQLDTQP